MSDIDKLIEWMGANQYFIGNDLLAKVKELKSIPPFSKTMKAVVSYTGVEIKTMKSRNRHSKILFARHLAMYYGIAVNKKSCTYTGAYFNRGHATAINSRNAIRGWIDTKDEKTLTAIREINNMLKCEINT